VLEGEGMHGLDGRIYPLAPGTVLVFNSFETHDCFLPEWATDCDHLWIMPIHDQFFIHRLRCRNGVCAYQEEWELLLSQEDTGLAPRRCLTGIGADSVLPAEFRRLRVQATVEGLIAAVVHALLSEASTENRTSFQERVIATTCRHIQTTAGKGINLDQLARISGYSKFHFLRLFQRFTGCSVHQYIDRCRLQRVEELEANGGSKTEIAETLGFSCQPAFSRWYRRWK